MIRISLSILYKKFNQTCTKRHMPNCRVRNRLNVLHKGGDFIKIEKISIVPFFMFDLMPLFCELSSKFHICLRSFAYWANLYFLDNLSATSRY